MANKRIPLEVRFAPKTVIGNWEIIEVLPANGQKNRQVLCKCKCGTVKLVWAPTLTSGRSSSCGCIQQGTHHLAETSEYKILHNIRQRCYNENHDAYDQYGGRGIKVYEPWIIDPLAFVHHIGPRPSPQHTVDRIDNDGNYEPGNVRWATRKEQSRNRRDNRNLTFNGITKPLSAWAESSGMSTQRLFCRLRDGMTLEQAINMPVRKWQRKQGA